MKQVTTTFLLTLLLQAGLTQNSNTVTISFKNDYTDVFHLSLIVYTPDGKSQIRVSDLQPAGVKTYTWPVGTEVFIADWQQEAYAMKGNDIKGTGIKPFRTLQKTDDLQTINLSAVSVQRNGKSGAAGKPNAADALGTWVIDLRPTPGSEPYLKEFKFTRTDSSRFDGEFYGYPFNGGYFNTHWDKIYFAFLTKDQTSIYYHSGYIEGNTVYGITLCEERKFVLPWKGMRKP